MVSTLEMINPKLARLAGLSGSRSASRYSSRSSQTDQPMAEEEQRSAIGKLRDGSIGTLAAVGNALDLPGSMVRDVLAWKNPLDQLLSPFSSDNRTSGRDLARQHGLAGRRDNWRNAIGGFAAEVALDPLTYMTFGGSALSKSGQLAKKAGLLDDLAGVAAKKAGKPIGEIGKREARLTTTLQDILQHGDSVSRDKARKLLNTPGVKSDEAMGGLARFGVPFMEPIGLVGTGNRAQSIARGADALGSKVRYGKIPGTDLAPVDAAARMFDVKLHDAKTKLGQSVATKLFGRQEAGRVAPQQITAQYANRLTDLFGDEADKYEDVLREMVEGVPNPAAKHPGLSPDQFNGLTDIARSIRKDNKDMLASAQDIGIRTKDLTDDEVDYAARFLTNKPGSKGKRDNRLLTGFDPSSMGRLDMFRDAKGGTVAIRKLAKDQHINDLIDQGADIDTIADAVERLHGGTFSDTYRVYDPKKGKFGKPKKGRYKAIAEKLAGYSKETREAGIFGNNTILDHQARKLAHERAVINTKGLADALSQPGVMKSSIAAGGEDTVDVGRFVADSSLNWGDDTKGFGKLLRSSLGQVGQGKSIKDLANLRISKEHAQDLSRIMKMVEGPESINEFVQFFDGITNFTKGMLTSAWPAFHVRNRVSGMVHNLLSGITDMSAEKAAYQFMQGKPVKGLKDIPAIRDQWLKQGGTGVFTDEQAAKTLGEMVYSHGVLGKFDSQATSLAGGMQRMPGTISEFMTNLQRPGERTFSASRVAKKFAGLEEGTSLNPRKARGVGGLEHSEFGPLAAGEEVGHFVEGMNRVAPFIKMMRDGFDPIEASKKVGAAQVMYSNRHFAPAEQQVFARIFPFYKFSSRVTPYVLKEIMDRPGGPFGAAIRAQRNAQKQDVMAPDYVRETASVPLGGALGSSTKGVDRYLTGLGLMHEDPLSFSPDKQGMLELASRTNPYLKAPMEWMTGQSFFQKGPDGGRKLDDMDPVIGRTLANLMGKEDAVKISPLIEHAAMNSPASRLLTSARVLTDKRKSLPFRLLPLTTGLRVSDISPAAKDAMIRELLQRAEKDAGAATFERVYFRKEDLAKMSPAEREEAEKLQALGNVLAQRAKDRKAEREAKREAGR